ncbi:type I restriction endonuclease [Blastopirellula sp. J2-11]|uniref:type I restriction endonuclease subunit R n=1 Tax=Blastopirellula sp. J2-11 TaxID=2943192 RepID=UPI0021C5832A|nr:type I restriction endonuclease [Blastopirellula sp. J2-11]UUO09025.1 type I restriction endonuclease [Blastopirellula sp. J2-11]
MSLHTEIKFEDEICERLAKHGWLYAANDAALYDRQLALFPADVIAWVQATQPDAWERLQKNHGAAAEVTLLKRLRDSLNQIGTLELLRVGFDVLGLQQPLKMAQFKPALAMNPDIMTRYAANRLRVVRQVRYSLHNENSIDLVLFLNGIPIATAELKTDNTQSLEDAVYQYKKDRDPAPKGKSAEPLLSFPSGALVHFAVSSSRVKMTTRLAGMRTTFLPFDQGDDGAAGNPLNPAGHRTAYLWDQVWRRESLLEILARYMVAERDKKKQITKLIFPRYHQLVVTRMLQDAVLSEGPGQKYLIQHSAGSGKTNSIAWTAHFLADLHDADNKKIFDTVLVVSDRKVIDGQLQEVIYGFERTAGVVATIQGNKGSKASELTEALSGTKKIVVCTIQTFPFALDKVRELAATEGKRFAVIADEAHSSQSGETAAKLKAVLSVEEQEELADGGTVSTEDIIAAEMTSRASDKGITYVAFTATPKSKTLELFGRPRDRSQPASKENLPEPFHVYSMRQAIEEGFILDVLKNYTSYKAAFKLAKAGEQFIDSEVERSTAMKGLMNWVRLHPHNIAQKVQIVVEHFREVVAPLLEGKAKAMVVVSSRVEAVRWQLAINAYIQEKGYALRTLVAFSGEVDDKPSGPDPFKETSRELNPDLKGRDIREAFKEDQFQILLVASKFQTGFDQPLLCGMYVDKRLDGIQAVQTLSRLNRCYPGKDDTFVLDFVNDPDEVLKAFKTYYATASLSDVTDPNIILNLRAKLDALGYYDDNEIERVINVVMNPKAKQSQLEAAITPVADRLVKRFAAAKESYKVATEAKDESAAAVAKDEMESLVIFRGDITTYVRAYTFLSQILDYGNTDFEKRAIFFKALVRLLKFGREREGVDLSEVTLTHHTLRHRGQQNLALSAEDAPQLQPMTEAGSGSVQEKQKALLSEIIEQLNTLFGGDTTDGDQLSYARTVAEKTLESEILQKQAANNTKEQFANSPDLSNQIMEAIMESMDIQTELSSRALNSPEIRAGLQRLLLDRLDLYEQLRARAAG